MESGLVVLIVVFTALIGGLCFISSGAIFEKDKLKNTDDHFSFGILMILFGLGLWAISYSTISTSVQGNIAGSESFLRSHISAGKTYENLGSVDSAPNDEGLVPTVVSPVGEEGRYVLWLPLSVPDGKFIMYKEGGKTKYVSSGE